MHWSSDSKLIGFAALTNCLALICLILLGTAGLNPQTATTRGLFLLKVGNPAQHI